MDPNEKLSMIIFCILRLFACFTIPLNIYILRQKHIIAETIRKIKLISYVFIIPAVIMTFCTTSSYILTNNYEINQTILYMQKIVQSTSGWIIRYSIFFILFERLIATTYWETYEKSVKLRKVMTFSIISLILLSLFTGLYLVFFKPTENFSFILMGVVALINFLLAWFLVWKNYQLKERTKNIPFLSQRYQIVENIQILRFLTPFIFLVTFMTSLGPLSGLVIPLFIPSVIIRNHIFYLNYDLYFCVSAFFFYKEYKRRQSHHKVENKRKIAWIDASSQNKVGPPAENGTVKTALGKSIPIKQSLDAHFGELNKAWKI